MQLARLLRIALVLLLVLAAIPAAFDAYGARRLAQARADFAQEVGEPDPAALATPSVDAEENAATWLERGAAALSESAGEGDTLARLATLAPAAWTATSSREAATLIAAEREALDLLRRAAYRRGAFAIDYTLAPEWPLPDYVALLRGSQLLLVDARAALARGDRVTALLDLEAISSAIGALNADYVLASKIIALALDRHYLNLARDMLAADPGDSHLLASLAGSLERRELRAGLRRGLHGEGTLIASSPARSPGQPATLRERLRALARSPFDDLFRADSLADYTEIAARLDQPWPALEGHFDAIRDSPRFWNRHVRLVAQMEDTARRLKALESAYGLARAATHYARTGEVSELGPDPFTGDALEASPLPGGGVTFVSPGAEGLWRRNETVPEHTQVPPFEWPVPARP